MMLEARRTSWFIMLLPSTTWDCQVEEDEFELHLLREAISGDGTFWRSGLRAWNVLGPVNTAKSEHRGCLREN